MKEFDKRLLNQAIKELTKEYENALKNPEVRSPLAYALYKTWRKFDWDITKTKDEVEA